MLKHTSKRLPNAQAHKQETSNLLKHASKRLPICSSTKARGYLLLSSWCEPFFVQLIGAFVFNEFFYLSFLFLHWQTTSAPLFLEGRCLHKRGNVLRLSSTPFLTDLDDMDLPLHWSSRCIFKRNGNILRCGLIRVVDIKIVVASECILVLTARYGEERGRLRGGGGQRGVSLGWGAGGEAWGYSVRGAYQLLTYHDSVTTDVAAGLILHTHVPLKVFIFMWRLLRDRLLTKANLVTQCILSPQAHYCVSGCGAVESAQHLFLSCSTFGSLWSLVRSWIGSSSVDSHTLSTGALRAHRSFMQLIWLACVWVVWNERNHRL
ncbi:hypothetical protein TSUD_140910 [Trifolium subterraneum]|uniref:Reverse transcriptase zinc-binding domain-containing protein n=1 Tax=Trifolium subterraneum TaxID=3900 RepID=A0A2Z6NGA0_TRISU|nr:hypothetical protein TSUD_140910 [Trifolium subterraneum]